jgi:signal transduction histidine kinase
MRPSIKRTNGKRLNVKRLNTLRFQFTVVIFLLAFAPNAVLGVSAGRGLGLIGGVGLSVWLAVVAVLSALVGWVLSGALLRPLSRLTAELAQGEFQPANTMADEPIEVEAMRIAFSGLLDRLGTEQERRSAFMATLVHDLKTPLIATGHLIRTLASRPLPDLERQTIGEHLLAENARLMGLVQQMADAHRFEREDVRLTPANTDLRALLERVAARVQQARPEVAVHVIGDGEAPVDAAVLERAVANLADNALRYAQRRLELRVGPDGLSVCDDGPGLPEGASIELLAQPFNAQPVEIAGQRYTAGTAGLGLYIVRRIAEAHAGSLIYHREHHPLGTSELTIMQIRLPLIFKASDPQLSLNQSLNSSQPSSTVPSSTLFLEVHSSASISQSISQQTSQEVHP